MPPAVILNRALAQVLEVVLCQGALLRDSVGRLAAVSDNDILLRSDWLANPLLFVDQEAFLLNGLRVESSRRLRLLQLLAAAVEDGDHVATICLRHTSQHLLQRVHTLTVQHTVRAVVHHTVAGVIDKQERVSAFLVVVVDVGASLINSDLELLVVRVLQNFYLAPAVLELE